MRVKIRLRVWRSIGALGLLLAFLGFFLSWFTNGNNLSDLYYRNGSLDASALLSSSNFFLETTFVLVPLGFVLAIWALWTYRPSPWQALLVAPAGIWLYYESEQGPVLTQGPLLVLLGGVALAVSYVSAHLHHEVSYRNSGQRPPILGPHGPRRPGRPGFRLPRANFLVVALLVWLVGTVGLGLANSDMVYPWYAVYFFGVIAGVWIGLRYFSRVSQIDSMGTLFLVFFGSLILAVFIGSLVEPFSTVAYYGGSITTCGYLNFCFLPASAGYLMFSYSIVSFLIPILIFVGLSILYSAYRASHTIFIR